MKDQLARVRTHDGFIAALDQSGGSTPKALRAYGIDENAYDNDEEMFSVVHEMRTRIVTSPAFNGDRILAAILFENTLDRQIKGRSSSEFLWKNKNVVPFLKVDKGLVDEAHGVQLMKPISNLTELLVHARGQGVFGTKTRSVIKSANLHGIASVVEQQFEIGKQIRAAGLMPIIEPEIDIKAKDKAEAEGLLREQLLARLEELDDGQQVMFKLTLPEQTNFFANLVEHPNVLRVVALSGGYTRDEANRRLAENKGVIASFSRALTQGLSAQLPDDEFNRLLDASIEAIYRASCTVTEN